MDIGFQLYSARNGELVPTLKALKKLGYAHVEGFGGLFSDVAGLRRELDANGLTMPTSHVGLDMLQKPDEALRIAETLGIELLVCPWLAPADRPTDAAGWRKLGETLEAVAQPYLKAGKRFGYHNHDFEFVQYDGRFAMDLLLEAAPSVLAEADVAWIVRGGVDPKAWLERNGDRVVAIHVKDIAKPGEGKNEDGWADVGQGVVPWADIIRTTQAKTKAEYFVVEHDNPSDIERFATRSIAALKSFGV